MDYAGEVAKAALEIGAITLSPDDPYTWASGFRMPIYNDNRKHLRYPENRKMITKALIDKINDPRQIDAVSGTTTAGIAPAASVAQALHVPVTIFYGDIVLQYQHKGTWNLAESLELEECDVIASTCPTSIVPAVFLANNKNLPFAYVREKAKGHGLQQQIEGIIEKGERVVLLDFYFKNHSDSYADRAKDAIEEKGAKVVQVISDNAARFLMLDPVTPDLKDQRIVHVEDLVSTGGSCIEEIEVYRKAGAVIDQCLAIFSYDFPESLQKFKEINCELSAALVYDQLLEAALEKGTIKQEQHEMLKDWRTDPFNWGEKHGFPKVEK